MLQAESLKNFNDNVSENKIEKTINERLEEIVKS